MKFVSRRATLALSLVLACLVPLCGCARTAEDPALTEQLAQAQTRCAALEQQTAALQEENQRLLEEYEALQMQLNSLQAQLDSLPETAEPPAAGSFPEPAELVQMNLRELADLFGLDLLAPTGAGVLSLNPASRTDWQPVPEGAASVRTQLNTTFSLGDAAIQEIPPEQAARLMVFLHLRFFLDADWSQRMENGSAFLIDELRDFQLHLYSPEEFPAEIPGERVSAETMALCEGTWYVLPEALVQYRGRMNGAACTGWTALFEDGAGPIAFSLTLRNGIYALMPLSVPAAG